MSRRKNRDLRQATDKQTPPPLREPLLDSTAAMMQFALSMQVSQSSSGPLPPPEVLAKYDAIMPGMAAQLVRLAEDEATHRRELENRAQATQAADIASYRRSEMIGQIFGCVIGIVAICGAVYAGVHGAQIVGAFIGTTGVTGLVAVFVLGRQQLIKQREMEFRHQAEAAKAQEERQRSIKEGVNKVASPAPPQTPIGGGGGDAQLKKLPPHP